MPPIPIPPTPRRIQYAAPLEPPQLLLEKTGYDGPGNAIRVERDDDNRNAEALGETVIRVQVVQVVNSVEDRGEEDECCYG